MKSSSSSYVPISDINSDLYISLSRKVRLAYHLDWIGWLTFPSDKISAHTEEIMEFIYFWREEIRYTVEEAILAPLTFESKRQDYHACYEKILSEFQSLYCIPQSVYKVETIVKALICLQLAYTAFTNKDYVIGFWYQQSYDSYSSQINKFKGYEADEVEAKGWHRSNRGSTIYQRKNIESGRDLVPKILKQDPDRLLSKSDIAEIIHDVLYSIHNNNNQQRNLIPSIRQIQEKWLSIDGLIPKQTKKRGRPKKEISIKKPVLKQKIISNLTK